MSRTRGLAAILAAEWIEAAVRIEPDPRHPTARDPIRQLRNMVPAFCRLCTDPRAMISDHYSAFSIAEPGDDQNFP